MEIIDISSKDKKVLCKKRVCTKDGWVPLDVFLASIGSNSTPDSRAYFSLVGILKELILD